MSDSTQQGGVAAADVAALVRALSKSGSNIHVAVADMLDAARQGKPVEVSTKGMPVPAPLLRRILEAAGADPQEPPVDESAVDAHRKKYTKELHDRSHPDHAARVAEQSKLFARMTRGR